MITEISENFYRITLPMPFRLRHVHAYALVEDGQAALFDAGMLMPGAGQKLEADLAGIGLSVADISDIYLTHTHTDHCGLAGWIQEKSSARLHLSDEARQMYDHFQQGEDLIARARLFYARRGLPVRDVEAIVEEIEDLRGRIPRFDVATPLRDRETRRFGSRAFEVIFTPGHAAGHVCFFFRDEGLLLAGDHILPYIAPSLSPTIGDEVFQPLASYLESLAAVEKLPVSTVYPGHGNSFNGVHERIHEIRDHHALKKDMLLKRIGARPQTTFGICEETIRAVADDWEKFMALNETYVYLQQLKQEGVIREGMAGKTVVYSVV
ncbi:MAG: MBL fold metallo-hydrolase [Smithella sp.]|jgi:glyoxylase-like metal-dependent hydrolase (beta-lactamase superfamily II)|nr:MBL fold metallo-hydrolase [Smithella sp.]